MATLIRTLVRGMNRKRSIRNFVSNEACLPRPGRVPGSMIFAIYGTYLLVWLMLLTEAYVMRTRSLAAGFFYRKREKRRILYLYNETLRRRAGFLRFARARVNRLARARLLVPERRFWLWLRLRRPDLFDWLGWFECARRTCSVCGDLEKSRSKSHHVCQTPDCYVAYCPECWIDVGRNCLICTRADSDASDLEYVEDDDYYDNEKEKKTR